MRDDQNGAIKADNDILFSHGAFGLQWSAPEALKPNAATDWDYEKEPLVVSDGQGHWIAAWVSTDEVWGAHGRDVLISHSYDNGVGWSPPQLLDSSSSGFVETVHLAHAGGQHWMAVWSDSNRIKVADSFDDGITWADAVELVVDSNNPISLEWQPELALMEMDTGLYRGQPWNRSS